MKITSSRRPSSERACGHQRVSRTEGLVFDWNMRGSRICIRGCITAATTSFASIRGQARAISVHASA